MLWKAEKSSASWCLFFSRLAESLFVFVCDGGLLSHCLSFWRVSYFPSLVSRSFSVHNTGPGHLMGWGLEGRQCGLFVSERGNWEIEKCLLDSTEVSQHNTDVFFTQTFFFYLPHIKVLLSPWKCLHVTGLLWAVKPKRDFLPPTRFIWLFVTPSGWFSAPQVADSYQTLWSRLQMLVWTLLFTI